MELVIFPKIFQQTKSIWAKNRIIIVEGRVEYREDSLSILVEKTFEPESITRLKKRAQRAAELIIQIPSSTPAPRLVELNKLLRESAGADQVALIFTDNHGNSKKMPLPYGINYDDQLRKKIRHLLA